MIYEIILVYSNHIQQHKMFMYLITLIFSFIGNCYKISWNEFGGSYSLIAA